MVLPVWLPLLQLDSPVCIVALCIVPMVLHLLYELTTVYLLLMGIG